MFIYSTTLTRPWQQVSRLKLEATRDLYIVTATKTCFKNVEYQKIKCGSGRNLVQYKPGWECHVIALRRVVYHISKTFHGAFSQCSWFIHFLLLIKLFLISLIQSSSLLVLTDIVNFSFHTKVSLNKFSKLLPKVLLNYKKLNYFYFLHYFLELPYTSILDPPWDCLEEICIEVIAQRSSTKKSVLRIRAKFTSKQLSWTLQAEDPFHWTPNSCFDILPG